MTHALNLTSPGELIAAVPFLLGFHPCRSILLMALRQRRLNLTQRLDLPDAGQEFQAAAAMIGPLLRDQPDSALVIGYEDHPGQSRPIIDRLSALLAQNQIPMVDRLVVYEGRWRSLDCADPHCCPPDGTQVPEPADVPHIAAEFVGAGVAPLTARVDLQDSVEAQASAAHVGTILERMDIGGKETGALELSPDSVADSWARVVDLRPDAPLPSVEDAAVTLISLRQVGIRDGIIALLMSSTLAPDRLPADVRDLTDAIRRKVPVPLTDHSWDRGLQQRLTALCRLAPDEHAAAPLTVLASYSWWAGDGTIARVALERARRCDPTYRLALLLEAMLDLGIRATDC
jgi:hypothetical protein